MVIVTMLSLKKMAFLDDEFDVLFVALNKDYYSLLYLPREQFNSLQLTKTNHSGMALQF